MLVNTLDVMASDGTKMKALLYGNKGKHIVIHVHGMAGNFYENTFIEPIALKCEENDIDFLCFNNRGHDYIADCEKKSENGVEYFSAGAAYENFVECVYDIEGVVHWALENGYESIVLQGHSSGANKIVYAYNKMKLSLEEKEKIRGVILISPCDDIGIYEEEIDSEKRHESMKMAEEKIANKNEMELMPIGTFFDYLLAAKTFFENFKDGSPLDMFPYRKGSLIGCDLKNIQTPMLLLFGDDGDFVLQDMEEISKMYSEVLGNGFELRVVHGANHGYKDCEAQLAGTIADWIGKMDL